MRLLLTEDRGFGRFVFGRQKCEATASTQQGTSLLVSSTESGGGVSKCHENSKNQLQTLMTRAGYGFPLYKTEQLQNNQFQSTVEFNGMQITGQPCNNKKTAEKDAAAEALQWLVSGNQQQGPEYINQMSMLLKKSKKNHPH